MIGLSSHLRAFYKFHPLCIYYHSAAVSDMVDSEKNQKEEDQIDSTHFDILSFCAVTFSYNGLSHPDLPTQTF